ncbi:MAG: MFS transporter [Pyrobaculum sp.]
MLDRRRLRFIVLLGVVSLFADWLYESMRSVAPQYLAQLGATAAFVGFVFGLGDALGYAARFVTGPLADRRGGYWLETFAGYGMQLAAVAGLVFATDIWQAAALIFLERFSKALRTPARDVLIASAGGEKARGSAFGIHAALDQIGAMAGASMATAILFFGHTPRDVFAVSLLPGAAALFVLLYAYKTGGVSPKRRAATRITAPLLSFALAQFLLGASLVHISLYMYKISSAPWLASLLYLISMAAEVPLSYLLGRLADRHSWVLSTAPLASAAAALFFTLGWPHLVAGAVLYSLVTSYADVVAKAHASKYGGAAALGVVNAAWGLGLLAGGSAYGLLVDAGAEQFVVYASFITALASLLLIWKRGGS